MWKSVLSDTLVEWEMLTPLAAILELIKKPQFLLKPTYDVGEQNYLA